MCGLFINILICFVVSCEEQRKGKGKKEGDGNGAGDDYHHMNGVAVEFNRLFCIQTPCLYRVLEVCNNTSMMCF